jgi:hypothetical protein
MAMVTSGLIRNRTWFGGRFAEEYTEGGFEAGRRFQYRLKANIFRHGCGKELLASARN